MKEIWADIEGYGGKYQVSTWGRVRSFKTGDCRILKPYKNKKGYLKIGLMKDGIYHKHRVNRLVAQTFIPNWQHLPEVNHKDGDKSNNSVTNLEWVSGRENRLYDKLEEAKWEDNVRIAAVARYHFPEDDGNGEERR